MMLLYIDPGTGSMLFSIFIGLAATLYFLFRLSILKFKTLFLGKKNKIQQKNSIVIYNEGDHYWPVFKPILDEFEKRKIEILYLTSSNADLFINENYQFIKYKFIGSGNTAFSYLNFLDADICLMTTPGLEVYQLKRSKFCKHYSHILHDTGDATCYRLFGIDWFDSILLSGEYQKDDIQELEKTRLTQKKELIIIGSTYLDYYNKKINNLPVIKNKPFTVLISPTCGSCSLLNSIGEKLLDCFINTDWKIIIRPHPQSLKSEKNLINNLNKKYNLFIWDFKTENLESLSQADIMISDFSGIIFDYAFLFNKPVLYHDIDFNREMYDAGDLGHDPKKFEYVKKFGIEINENDLPNLKEIIEKTVSNNSLIHEITEIREIAWQNRGQSGEYAVNALLKYANSNDK